MGFSALSEADQRLTVTAESPTALQSEPSRSSAGQVTLHQDGTKVLRQSEVDLLSEGTLRNVVVLSAEPTHGSFYRRESKDDGDIQFAVEEKGDFKFTCYTSMHGQLIVEPLVKISAL